MTPPLPDIPWTAVHPRTKADSTIPRRGADMKALEIAECFDLYAIDHTPEGWPAIRQDTLNKTAAMLRRQHEAIVKLREALKEIQGYVLEHGAEYVVAEQALKDTEGL